MKSTQSNEIKNGGAVKLSYSSMKIISKKHGVVEVKYDSEFEGTLSKYTWSVTKIGKNLYALTCLYCKNTKKSKFIYMHRLLTSFKYPLVDHINRDSLDNRLSNLRPATRSQNSLNSRNYRNDLPKGVYFRKDTGKFFSRYVLHGKTYNVGTFSTAEEAFNKREEALRASKIKL